MCENEQFPRRICVDQLTPAEKAIYDAVQAVESLQPDVRLTEAVILLQSAREAVADFVDGVEWEDEDEVSDSRYVNPVFERYMNSPVRQVPRDRQKEYLDEVYQTMQEEKNPEKKDS